MDFLGPRRTFENEKNLRFDDFTAAQAGGANAHALCSSADAGVHRTQINIPAPLSDVMRVADAVSRLRLLAADIALLCHYNSRSSELVR